MNRSGGLCFYRNMTGLVTLWKLGIRARIALGGLVHRVGPDERRDVVAFCGRGNVGTKCSDGLAAHYFIVSGDKIVDFSVGDWPADSAVAPECERAMGSTLAPGNREGRCPP